MSSPYSALAAKVRAKFPGTYDDMSDDALGQAVVQKHPEYQDLVQPPSGSIQMKKGGPVVQPSAELKAQFGDNSAPPPAVPTPNQTQSQGSFLDSFGTRLRKAVETKPDDSPLTKAGKGFASVFTSLPEAGVSFLRDWPEKPTADASQYQTRGQQALTQGDPLAFLGHSINQVLAPTGIPQMIEGLSNTDPYEASGNVIGQVALMKAPEAISAASEKLAPVRQALADNIVAPLTYEGVGEAGADSRMGINPEKGITQEGLVGTKKGLVAKATTRVTQLKTAANQILQNHPNSTVQIDATPHIDGAIDAAVAEANKTGAPTDRLEAIRNAMKTQYGPTQGTPLEMNNFATDLQQRANGLGAFKNTQPVEASAASAMSDAARRIRQNVNSTIPEVEDLNTRMANLLDARSGLTRKINAERGQTIFGNFGRGMVSSSLNSTIGSAPVRTGVARLVNAGNTLDVPEVATSGVPPTGPNWPQTPGGIPPTGPNFPQTSGGVPPTGPIRGLLPGQRYWQARVGGGSGPATSAGPGEGVFPSNPTASSGRVPSAIPLADSMPSPILPPERQLPPVGGTGTGGAPNSDVVAPKVGTQPMQAPQMPASPPQATVSPYLTGKHEFAIIPADSPADRAIAIKELRAQGYQPQVIQGASEGQPGTSLFIPDMPTHAALDFQKHMTGVYGQQSPHSIITKQGLVNLERGTAVPIDFSRTVFGPDATAKPSYSVASGGGEQMPFALNPNGKEIPVKTPYEGEHYSDTVPSGAKRISGSRGVQASPDTAARLQVSPNDAVPRVYFQDKGTVAMGPTGKNVHAFKGDLSIADISTNQTYKNAWTQAAQEAQAKGLPLDAIRAYARTKAENALAAAGWDGYRNPKFPGITAKFGDADVFKPGEEPEPPALEPHPNAPEPTIQPAPSPTSRASGGAKPTAPKARMKNGSGESSASQEAINRVRSEKTSGIQRYRIDTRSGNSVPLIGVDAVDARPGPFDVIVQRQNGTDTVLDKGMRANYPFPSRQKWR